MKNELLNPQNWASIVLLMGLIYYFYKEYRISKN